MAREKPSKWLSDEEVEALFATVDETGHSNGPTAKEEHRRRARKGVGLEVDPLSGKDPSGSNVGTVITRVAVAFVVVMLIGVVGAQMGYSFMRRASTANLSANVTTESVAAALRGGVEWGDGFTQFPDDFSVQEADEASGRVEVSVVDITSENEMEAMAGGYIQATAFSMNALLNPNIKTVIYHVDVHTNDEDQIEHAGLFGLLKPDGQVKNFMTFIFTKSASKTGGFNIFCTITGIDESVVENLRAKIGTSPLDFLGTAEDAESTDEDAEKTDDTATGASTADGEDAKAAADNPSAASDSSAAGSDAPAAQTVAAS